tara:strand:+ start:496 stop:723 length:228 start_codon:yes stop_codon:yes gene_type:complete
MRKITIVSTQANERQDIQSDATTWGQLRTEVPHLISNDMKATVRETRVDLVHEDAMLPEGEFVLFLFPEKVKSGL